MSAAFVLELDEQKHADEEAGTWKPYHPTMSKLDEQGNRVGPWVLIRPTNSAKYQQAITRYHRKHARLVNANKGVLPRNLQYEMIATYGLLDWSGFGHPETGAELPYTPEWGIKYLTFNNKFRSDVQMMMTEDEGEETEVEETEVKN